MNKTILTGLVLTLMAATAYAQQPENTLRNATVETKGDSIIIRKGTGDMRIKIYEDRLTNGTEVREREIYEGVFVEHVEEEQRTFFDALPFIPKKKKQNNYDPHCSGLYLGFSRMSKDFLSFSEGNTVPLDLSESWEVGINLAMAYHQFRSNPHWGFNISLNWGYRSFRLDGSRALLKGDGESYFVTGDAETAYSKSRLRYNYFRIPLQLEWQQRVGQKKFFVNAGPEVEIRHSVKSVARVNEGKKQTLGKGMYVRPVGVNLLAQAGYGNLGVYLRYSNPLFQQGKGPDVSPYSFGIAWYW